MAIILQRPLNGGTQVVHKFDNGFGASVVRHDFSYGNSLDLYELAVLKFQPDDSWTLTYATPITDDVLGHLTDEDVAELLQKIEQL